MKIYNFAKASSKKMDHNGTVEIRFDNDEIIFKISLSELLAINTKACNIISQNEKLPEDFLKQIQDSIEIDYSDDYLVKDN